MAHAHTSMQRVPYFVILGTELNESVCIINHHNHSLSSLHRPFVRSSVTHKLGSMGGCLQVTGRVSSFWPRTGVACCNLIFLPSLLVSNCGHTGIPFPLYFYTGKWKWKRTSYAFFFFLSGARVGNHGLMHAGQAIHHWVTPLAHPYPTFSIYHTMVLKWH